CDRTTPGAPGQPPTEPGSPRSSSASAPPRRRCSTTWARSTPWSAAATRSSASSTNSSRTRPGQSRSPGCAACAASTRCPPLGYAPRSATSAASTTPAKLMSYLGLVPSENSSGQTRRQGAITKSGSRHARRLLVEAAWHYRRPPRNGTTLQRRQQGQPAQLLAISWKAQQRLHQLWRRLDGERGKRKTIVAVAVARHLAGFCWAITTTDPNT